MNAKCFAGLCLFSLTLLSQSAAALGLWNSESDKNRQCVSYFLKKSWRIYCPQQASDLEFAPVSAPLRHVSWNPDFTKVWYIDGNAVFVKDWAASSTATKIAELPKAALNGEIDKVFFDAKAQRVHIVVLKPPSSAPGNSGQYQANCSSSMKRASSGPC